MDYNVFSHFLAAFSLLTGDCHYYYKLGSVQFTRDWKVNGKIVVVGPINSSFFPTHLLPSILICLSIHAHLMFIVKVKSPPKRVVRLRIDMGKMYFVTNVASSERSPVIHAEHSLDGKRWQKFKVQVTVSQRLSLGICNSRPTGWHNIHQGDTMITS